MRDIHQTNEPLSNKLRLAALDRTITDSERVDDFVLDADGVIDLRQLEQDPFVGSIADPAASLATLRGRLGDAAEVSELYDESELSKPRWRRGLRARHSVGSTVSSAASSAPSTTSEARTAAPTIAAPIGRLSKVTISPQYVAQEPIVVADTGVFTGTADKVTDKIEDRPEVEPDIAADIDLRQESRPTADCPKCAGLGHRDLYDRFSQAEFYSCDHCNHMWQQDAS